LWMLTETYETLRFFYAAHFTRKKLNPP
jgi:hypothetical protein